jgi:hypothetical protein
MSVTWAVPARPLRHQKLMTQREDLSLQSSTRSETALHRGEQAKEESKHFPAAYTPRLHKSNRFNDNEFLVWTIRRLTANCPSLRAE